MSERKAECDTVAAMHSASEDSTHKKSISDILLSGVWGIKALVEAIEKLGGEMKLLREEEAKRNSRLQNIGEGIGTLNLILSENLKDMPRGEAHLQAIENETHRIVNGLSGKEFTL